jgi:hypothetical protein
MRHGRRVATVVTALLVVFAVTAVALGLAADRHRPRVAVPARPPHPLVPAPSRGLQRQALPFVAEPPSPAQEEGDQLFARGLGATPGMRTVEEMQVPPPAVSGGWPSLPVIEAPGAWAESFLGALLDVDYARRSGRALGPWLEAEEAPDLLPGVPASVADKVLYVSLLDPSAAGEQASPVPTARRWAALGREGATQRASDLEVQVDPGWAQLLSSGWQPVDPRMVVLDVSGLLTDNTASALEAHRFSCSVALGSARWHAGYGAVAVGDWQEG